MALVLTSRSAAWGTDEYPTNSHNLGGSDAGYYAGEVPFGSGSREIPHNDGRGTHQWCYVTPKVTARLNSDYSITITKIEATGLKFCYRDNGIPVGTRLWGMTGDYFVRASNGSSWWWDKVFNWTSGYYTNSLASYCNGLSPSSRTVWSGSHTIPCGGSWEVDVAEFVSNGGELGHHRTVTVKMANTYSEPVPEPPTLSLSCRNNTSVATAGSFSASGHYGYCKGGSNSTKYWLYRNSDLTGLVTSGTGSSANFYGLAANTKYYVNVIRDNGCFVVEKTCSFTTLVPNTLADATATSWQSGCVRVAVTYGNGAYKPTTTVKLRKCSGGAWKNVGTTTTTTVDTVCFDGLEEETCYQLQACTTTTAGTYCGNVVTFTTPKKCVQANPTSVDIELNEKTWESYATICVNWEAYSSPAQLFIEYRVKDGYDPDWKTSEVFEITDPITTVGGKLTGSHCFTLHDLFPNLTTYEFRIVGLAPQDDCELRSDLTDFTTPMVPEPDPVKVCETMTYLYELVCQSVKKLYSGNKTIYPNPTTQELCDPYSNDPTLLTLMSRLLRFFHAANCLLCGMTEASLKVGNEDQYYVGEVGWVDMLKEVKDPDDPESWRIATSDAILKYMHEALKAVWHYIGTVDVLVDKVTDLGKYPNAMSAIVASEDKVYKKVNGSWVVDDTLTPEDFGVYHINMPSETDFGNVKAESAYYYWQGTWNNLDADTDQMKALLDKMMEEAKQMTEGQNQQSFKINVNSENFDYSALPCERTVCFVTEDMDLPPKGSYRITFITGAQATIIVPQEVLQGATAQRPTDPTRTGYVFNDWIDQDTGQPFSWTTPIYANHTVVAKWDPLPVTVTFDINGAVGDTPAPLNLYYGDTVPLPTDSMFTYAGATFGGWMRDGVPFTGNDTLVGDTTLVAFWQMDEFDVTFHPDNGSADIVVHLVYGSAPAEFADPTKTDNVFMGWFTSPTPGTGASFDFSRPIYGPTDVYARWVPATYTITYDSAGGSAVATQTVAYNTYPTQPANPTKTGMVFGWWMLDGQRYLFDQPITENVQLTAKWLNRYTVKFIDSFGDTVWPDQIVTEGNPVNTIGRPTPTRPGYTFTGWYKQSDNTRWDIENDLVGENMTLVAIFTAS